MDNKLVICRATSADLAAIEACAVSAYQIYVGRIGRPPAPMTADFSRQIEAGIIFVARQADELAGYLVCFAKGNRFHIENVAVNPHQQGQGIGKVLLTHAEETAAQAGIDIVELYTNELMTENLIFYPRLGYREVARRVEDGFRRVYFEKSLKP